MPESDIVRLAIANRCAASTRSSAFSVTAFCIVWLAWLIAFAFQKYAVAVSYGVRTVLFRAPNASVSFRSFVYRRLVSEGGGSALNCEGPSSMNGRIVATHG